MRQQTIIPNNADLKLSYVTCASPESEREIKFISLFGDRGHRSPYSPYKLCNHNLYTGIIIFPHIDNPQPTGYNQPKKKTTKIINERSEGPINLTNHWRKRLWISLHMDLKDLTKPQHWNKALSCNNMSTRRKRVISTEEIQFNHKPAKMLLTEKRRESAKMAKPQV